MVRRTLIVCLLAAALAAAFAVPAGGVTIARGRFGVGDSIMLSSSDELAPFEIGVNAEVSRRFDAGIDVVRRLANRDKLPRRLIVHLGTNGPVTRELCDEMVAAAPHRRIFLVTVRVPLPAQDPNNEVLRECAAAYDRVHVIRWYRYSAGHPEWFADDGYHLSAEGQDVYAAYLEAGSA